MTFFAIEEWKPIPGYEGLYEVSSFGKVKSCNRYAVNHSKIQFRPERILKPYQDKRGYRQVALCKDAKITMFSVHRLVADAFIENPDNKPEVDHIDTVPSNNYVWNLQWTTRSENVMNPLTRKHDSDAKKGHQYWGRPLTDEEKKKISDAHKGKTFSEEHRRKLSESHRGKHWKMEGGKKVWY